jgi:hypothetical protein
MRNTPNRRCAQARKRARRLLIPGSDPPGALARATRAMSLLADQSKTRAALIEKRQLAAERLGTLRVEMGGIDARRARLVAEAGPATYLAKLFDSDGEAAGRAVIALIVGIIDPLAVLLGLAVSRGRP